jgi:hypothetical protein
MPPWTPVEECSLYGIVGCLAVVVPDDDRDEPESMLNEASCVC